MSARPTPETDEQEKMDNGDTAPLLAFARSLERERDEARELAQELRDELVWKGKLVGLTRRRCCHE